MPDHIPRFSKTVVSSNGVFTVYAWLVVFGFCTAVCWV